MTALTLLARFLSPADIKQTDLFLICFSHAHTHTHVDTLCQVLVNLFLDVYTLFTAAYKRYLAHSVYSISEIETLGTVSVWAVSTYY